MYILKFVRPSNIQAWVAANAPGSLRATGRESWRAYLAANGGTGSTLAEQELKFASANSGSTGADKWSGQVSATSGSSLKEKLRNLYK